MRVLSPSIDPPVTCDEGSMHSTATFPGLKLEGFACSFSFMPKTYIPKASTKVDFPTPGGPAIPSRKEDAELNVVADCFSLSSSMSAIRRFLGDWLSTSVIALDNEIRWLMFRDEMSLFSSTNLQSLSLERILAAKRSIVLSSSSVRDGNDDDVANRS